MREKLDKNGADMDRQNAELIEEYKTLRTEILQHSNNQHNMQTIWLGIIVTILTIAILQKLPWACLLAWIFNWYSWRRSRSITSSIAKIGTYISIFIEPKTQGLRWETSVAKIDNKIEIKSYFKAPYNYSRILFPHAVVSLISVIAGLILLYTSTFNHLSIFYLYFFILLSFTVNSIYFYNMLKYGWREERAYWMSVWKAELARQNKDKAQIRKV